MESHKIPWFQNHQPVVDLLMKKWWCSISITIFPCFSMVFQWFSLCSSHHQPELDDPSHGKRRFFSEAPGLFTFNLWQCQEEHDDQLINFGDIRWYPILFHLKPEILMSCCNFGQLFQDAHRISLTSGHHSWPRKVDSAKWKKHMTCRINSKVCAKVLSRLWSCSGQMSVLRIPIEKFFTQDASGTLWWTNSLLLKMTIEMVDFPIKHADFPWQNVSSPEGTVLQWSPGSRSNSPSDSPRYRLVASQPAACDGKVGVHPIFGRPKMVQELFNGFIWI